jgi:hypothetical protein
MVVFCCSQLSNEGGVLTAAARSERCFERASATSARLSKSDSDRLLAPDAISATLSIVSGRIAVPFHVQHMSTSLATNWKVLRQMPHRLES